MRSLLLPFALTPVLAVAALAQGSNAITDSFGVTSLNGTLLGVGPTYSARFDADGFRFAPVLGSTAPGDANVQFALDSVQRGGVQVFARGGDAGAPAADGNVVRYRRSRDLTEVYDVRQDGIEQQFVFAQRPAGEGDLVVAGRLTTGLPLVTADVHAGLHYAIDGLGGVTIGAVTGIDALGNKAAGTIRAIGERVEYSLPGWFVDRAAYPLTLDPLFGAALQVSSSAAQGAPDVAFDASNQRYCVVWNVSVSNVQTDVRGALVGATGVLVGGSLVFSNIGDPDQLPRVANVNATNRFVIGWVRQRSLLTTPITYVHELMARTLDAGTGVLTNEVLLYGQTSPQTVVHVRTFDIGGESRTILGANEALFVFRVTKISLLITYEFLYSGLVNVPASGDASLVGGSSALQTLTTTGAPSEVSVSNHGGSQGRWFAVWSNSATGTAPFTKVEGQVINSSNQLCGSTLNFVGGSGADLARPTIATKDGEHFAVAWQDNAAGRLRIMAGNWSGTCGSGGVVMWPGLDPVQGSGTVTAPSLDFAQNKYVLAYRRRLLLFPGAVYVKSLDPTTCAICGSEWLAESSTNAQDTPAIVANWSGDNAQQDGAFLVWQTVGNVRGIRYDATGTGLVANLGGSCGAAGGNIVGYNGSPVLGSLDFALTLSSPTAPVAGLIVGLSNVSVACGPCTLVPAMDGVFGGPGPHSVPLPCDLSYLGVTFWTQWVLLAPGGCALTPDLALSTAQRFTIGE